MNQVKKIEQLNKLLEEKDKEISRLSEYNHNLQTVLEMNRLHNSNSLNKCKQLILDLEEKNKELLVSINQYKIAKNTCNELVKKCNDIARKYQKEHKMTIKTVLKSIKK